jgi:hypothetical protein
VLVRLAEEIHRSAQDLALEVVEEGLADDEIPSLGRLGRDGQLGDVPTFIDELGRQLGEPEPTACAAAAGSPRSSATTPGSARSSGSPPGRS